jgi:predicted transcriptional regulator
MERLPARLNREAERIRTYGRTILYGPAIRESTLARPIVRDVMRRLFGGEARPMISHLLQDEKLSLDDLECLEDQISARCESPET